VKLEIGDSTTLLLRGWIGDIGEEENDTVPNFTCRRIGYDAPMHDPFTSQTARPHRTGDFTAEEVALANRNSGLMLEGLRYDVTPAGMHYLLSHFDVPHGDAATWTLDVKGRVEHPRRLSMAEIMALPARTQRVTMECAGNGRIHMTPRYPTQPWACEAVGTAEWTGTPLRHVLDAAGVQPDAVEVAFIGADRGFDKGVEHEFGRSLTVAEALREDVLLVWAMNGAPLLPQHGAPLRLIVPGWYGMASVKWLREIEALDQPYTGFQQIGTYMYRSAPGARGVPVTTMRVKSLMAPPGIPDWYTRRRLVEAGPVEIMGRAWSGGGVPIVRVELGIDGLWQDATLQLPSREPSQAFAWQRWSAVWQARPGTYTLACRATDAGGETQPLEPRWDNAGFGNNVVQRVGVTVRQGGSE
jgi:DMSO/TMAO reductase YedYZ molybdopterin-dependent catalytic subunit